MLMSKRSRAKNGHCGCWCCYDYGLNAKYWRTREKRNWKKEIRNDY